MERLTKRDEYGKAVKVKSSRDTYICTIEEEERKLDQEVLERLAEYEDKIENGTLIECNPNLIGEMIIGIHHFTNGTYQLDLDENLVIGFTDDGVVTWNNYHKYNDYFKNGLYFIDNKKGRAEAEAMLKELRK